MDDGTNSAPYSGRYPDVSELRLDGCERPFFANNDCNLRVGIHETPLARRDKTMVGHMSHNSV